MKTFKKEGADKYELYAITDRKCLVNRSLEEAVEEALDSGISILQLREKDISEKDYICEAIKIKKLCLKYNIPLIINDNVEVAIKSGADGVHLGQTDMDLIKAREVLGKEKIIGVSAKTVEQAVLAEKNGATYLGVGAVFNTNTKKDAKPITKEVLKEICLAVNIPVVAIGGIEKDNIKELKDTNIDGIAVVSAIFGKDDIKKEVSNLKENLRKIIL